MGYYISGGGDIAIPQEHQGPALAAVQAKRYEPPSWRAGKETSGEPGSWQPGWLSMPVGEYDALAELVEDYGFGVRVDPDGTLHVEDFDNKASDEEELFDVLAPFVTPGSQFTWSGEEPDSHWRWVFDGETVKTQYGQIVFVAHDDVVVKAARQVQQAWTTFTNGDDADLTELAEAVHVLEEVTT